MRHWPSIGGRAHGDRIGRRGRYRQLSSALLEQARVRTVSVDTYATTVPLASSA